MKKVDYKKIKYKELVKQLSEETGIGVTSIQRILSEYKQTGTVKLSNNKKNKIQLLDKIGDSYKDAIRRKIDVIWCNDELPTIAQIVQAVEEDVRLPTLKRTTMFRLLEQLNLKYTGRQKNSMVTEIIDKVTSQPDSSNALFGLEQCFDVTVKEELIDVGDIVGTDYCPLEISETKFAPSLSECNQKCEDKEEIIPRELGSTLPVPNGNNIKKSSESYQIAATEQLIKEELIGSEDLSTVPVEIGFVDCGQNNNIVSENILVEVMHSQHNPSVRLEQHSNVEAKEELFDPEENEAGYRLEIEGEKITSRPQTNSTDFYSADVRCQYCSKMRRNLKNLEGHKCIHRGRFSYEMNKNVSHDHNSSYLGNEKHKCLECLKTYSSRSHLKLHQRSQHLNIRPYKCLTCDKSYANSNNLRKHQTSAHSKMYNKW